MIKITLPDGIVRTYNNAVKIYDIALEINPSLAKRALVAEVDGNLTDLTSYIDRDVNLRLFTWDDAEGKSVFWHTTAHLMAAAVEQLFPGAKFGIGPAIEHGFYYDIDFGENSITEANLPAIEKKMRELCSDKYKIICKNLSRDEVLQYYKKKGNEYKVELIEEINDAQVTLYELGSFADLCRGPHLPDVSYIKAFKLFSVAGAYWRGDISRKQLTRIYGVSFPSQKLLDEYLIFLEEAKKRDHRKLGKELEFFAFSQNVGMGLPLWLPKGVIVSDLLKEFLKKIQRQYGYEHVGTSHIADKNLFVISGHYEKYAESSFQPLGSPIAGEEFFLKPMNCPHHCEIYSLKPRTYKELPLRYAEFGTVYRYEQSGELHGLIRVRGFTQDDAHIFCTNEQLKEEFVKVIEMVMLVYNAFSFTEYTAQISLRNPDDKKKYIGSDENWARAEKEILEACELKSLKTETIIGEAAFYGPKLDFMVKDVIGRKWQLGTIQIDYNLPEKFCLRYTGADNNKHQPVMIHRTIFGSLERFVAVLLEHTGGNFPFWLSPLQIIILPISENFNNFANEILNIFIKNSIRASIDMRNEKINKKIRDAEVLKIPYMVIIGEKEFTDNTISVRRHRHGDIGNMKTDELMMIINKEINYQI